MSKETEKTPDIKTYSDPAGGWGAVRATGEVLIEQKVPIKGSHALWLMNKPGGFDCPGCGWPDPSPDKAEPLVFCENGAKALAWEATALRAGPEFFAQHTVAELQKQSDHWLEQQGRLTEPMVYDGVTDRYQPITWADAFKLIGESLRALPDPNQAEFYTSGRTSNEAAFLFQLFVREYGTNNFPDCSNYCHEATSQGLPPQIGAGKGTCLLDDFEHCDAIFIFGQNPGTNSPRMMTDLRAAARRGVPIVAFNPLRERALERFTAPQNPVEMLTLRSTPICSHYYQLKIGGDFAALQGMMKAIIALDDQARETQQPRAVDVDFIREHCHGFDELCESVRATEWQAIETGSGLSRAQLEEAAQIYVKANAVMSCWGMGITQHSNGTRNVQQIVNLMLLRGNIGKPGAGLVPVRGHSNVQGDRTVGINERPKPEMLDRLQQVFGFAPPRAHGHDVVAALDAIVDGRSKVFIGLGGNFVMASPDTEVICAGLRKLDLTVNIATKLNRSHLVIGHQSLILPCLGRTERDLQNGVEQEVTAEDAMCMVHASRGHAEPAGEHLRSEIWIVAQMARATLGAKSVVDWEGLSADYARIRDKIEQVFPEFKGFNQRIRQPGGFHLGNSARERNWKTASGKANFMVHPFQERPLDDNSEALLLTSIRSHDQFNTTIYSTSDRYRGVVNQRDVLFISEREMEKRGLKFGDRVDIRTVSIDEVERVVRSFKIVPFPMPEGCCAGYYPETNPLVPLYARDPVSGTPASKSVPVMLIKSA
jgi:molybdopterin-dependent oxidoreductase alpha subunit